MEHSITHKIKSMNMHTTRSQRAELPKPLPTNPHQRLIEVFVEGYEDVAFWRGIFDHFANPHLRFEVSVPTRRDLPKGKKILINTIPKSSQNLLLCVDSDFDYLFAESTAQSQAVNASEFMFHTYTYATENYLCYAPSLHNICVKATKNDTHIFDFELFMAEYSKIIFPVFLWYSYSAQQSEEHMFILADFKQTVRIGYLDIENNGEKTLEWVANNVDKRLKQLIRRFPKIEEKMEEFKAYILERGVTPETTYLYMHGHTLMDSVVLVILNVVCEKLRQIATARIISSSKRGTAFKNEISNYTNSQRSIRDVLLDNVNYTSCPLYKHIHTDIGSYVIEHLCDMRRKGEITKQELTDSLSKLRKWSE